MMSNQNLQRVMGMFDPATRSEQDKSGKAILAEQNQAEMSNFHGYDNLTRSLKHTGRIILSYIPPTYDVQRVQRIIGEDGKDELVTLNERQQPSEGEQTIMKVLNDVRIGTYDVVMETGPGYDTKRQEGVNGMLELMRTPIGEKVAGVGDDLMVRWMDFPGSDVLADRLAAANPLSQIDEKSEVPPQAQMAMANMKQKIEKLGGVIQELQLELKFRNNLEMIKQDGENKRTLMTTTAKAHDVEMRNASVQHSTETKAITAQNVAEIGAMANLLGKGMDAKALDKEIAKRDEEQQAKIAQSPGTTVE